MIIEYDFQNWEDFPVILSNNVIESYYIKYKNQELSKGNILYWVCPEDQTITKKIIIDRIQIFPALKVFDKDNEGVLLKNCKKIKY